MCLCSEINISSKFPIRKNGELRRYTKFADRFRLWTRLSKPTLLDSTNRRYDKSRLDRKLSQNVSQCFSQHGSF